MNDITKLAFIDELEKIGYINSEMAEHLMKEAGLLSGIGKALTRAPKAMPKLSPQQMAAMKAQWRAGAGRAGQATRKITATPAMAPVGGGGVGAGTFGI